MDNKQNKENIKNKYELLIFMKDGDDANLQKIYDLANKFGISVIQEEPSRRIRLAYPIEKNSFANMIISFIEADPDSINMFLKEMRVQNLALRFMVTKSSGIKRNEQIRTENFESYTHISRRNEISSNVKYEHKKPLSNSDDPSLKGTVTNEELEEKLKEILS